MYVYSAQPKETNKIMIEVSAPLLIRLLEFAKEDAKTDLDLHFVVEYMLSKKDHDFTMKDYAEIMKHIPTE